MQEETEYEKPLKIRKVEEEENRSTQLRKSKGIKETKLEYEEIKHKNEESSTESWKFSEEEMKNATEVCQKRRLWIVTNSSIEGEETDTILRAKQYE